MNCFKWIMLISSAFLYGIAFVYNPSLWWMIFIFPIPLLYLTITENLSFMHGYLCGVIVFSLHLQEGVFIVARLAGDSWWCGFLMGIGMILFQALCLAILFYAGKIILSYGVVSSPINRVLVWVSVLWAFTFLVDQYCLSIFGITEGYPLMHPLIVLAQQPTLLLLLPILGKQLLTLLFFLVPASFTLWTWYKNSRALLFFMSVCLVWVISFLMGWNPKNLSDRYNTIKSLPSITYGSGGNKELTMKIVARDLTNILLQYPNTTTIIMPESALNIGSFENQPDILRWWNQKHLGKPLHIIFGACREHSGDYYNSLYSIYDGVVQKRFDKTHAMLMTERLAGWMNYDCMRALYFKDDISITRSDNERMVLKIAENIAVVPYICSELFFNEYPDDNYPDLPILAIVNDILFRDEESGYMKLLLLRLAQFKAIQWQREIIYVSYWQSVVIDVCGRIMELNR